MADFSTSVEDVTTDWLSEILQHKVAGYDTTFLEGGVLCDAYKLRLRFAAAGPNAPASIVLKLPNREHGALIGLRSGGRHSVREVHAEGRPRGGGHAPV